MNARRIEITVSQELWDRLENARGHEPRASFVKRALESRLSMTFPDVPQVEIPPPPVRPHPTPKIAEPLRGKIKPASSVPPPQFNRAKKLG